METSSSSSEVGVQVREEEEVTGGWGMGQSLLQSLSHPQDLAISLPHGLVSAMSRRFNGNDIIYILCNINLSI